MAVKYPPPSPPFIRARNQGGRQTPKAIVMHGTVSSDNAGTARNIARWWNGSGSPMSSCHYVVDPKEVIQCVGDHSVAYHCGYNTGSIGVELCDEQAGPASRWRDADSRAILARAARLVAELCLAYNIEPVRPTTAQLRAKGPHGIYGHNDSRLAFGRTTHTDPRDFDWQGFLRLVRAEIAKIKAEANGGNTGTKKDKMRPEAYFVGAKGPHVRWLANRLVKHGFKRFYKNGVDKTFTAGEDRKALAAFQRSQGWKGQDANGLPGPVTLKRLAAKPKPKHKDEDPAPQPPRRRLRLRVHNQHDVAMETDRFDIGMFTERGPTPTPGMKRFTSKVKGLAIEVDPKVVKVLNVRTKVAHRGIARRTPKRGTMVMRCEVGDVKVAVLVPHRINNASGPVKRRLRKVAERLWARHARMDAALVRGLRAEGYRVILGGDINNRNATLSPLNRAPQTFGSYDALGLSDDIRLVWCRFGPRAGSDHRRLTASVALD